MLVPVPEGVTTDEQVIALWLTIFDSPSTIETYRADAGRFLDYVERRPLGRITLPHLIQYRETMKGDGLKPTTINRRMAAAKSLLSFAHRIGYLPFNVGAAVRTMPVRPDLASRTLTREQVNKLIDAVPLHRDRAMLKTIYQTGCRAAEACGIRAKDLRQRPQGGQITVYGKRGKERTILISPVLYRELAAMIQPGQEDSELPLFPNRHGKAVSPRYVQKVIEAAAKKAKLGKVSPHWLRHSHATHAVDNGCPLPVVRDTLGHASLTVTSRYVHALPHTSSSQFLNRKAKGRAEGEGEVDDDL